MKKISVITINYNNKKGLAETIESVVSQPLFPMEIEYILIDGNSNDGSLDLIIQNQQNFEYWVSEKDEGIFHAMNKGLQKATGEYVIFMNSGDVFCPNVLDETLIRNFNSKLVYGNYYEGNSRVNRFYKQTQTIDFAFLLGRTICHQTVFIERNLCAKYPFEYHFNIIGDWIQLFRIMKNENPTVNYIDRAICIYNNEGLSVQQNEKRLEQRKEFLKLNYSEWELETLTKIGRLRTREYYNWIVESVDSYKRSIIIKWLRKVI